MRVSLVIPYYHCDDDKPGVLCGAVSSMIKFVDELIVVSEKLDNLATKINYGLSKTTGDFIIVTNDDVSLVKGTLDDLCDPGAVLTPFINGGARKTFHGHAWGMPRWVYEKIGGMDEDYLLYYMDTDYAMRLKQAGIPCYRTDKVDMKHPDGARTLKHWVGKTEHNDREVFIRKWGQDYYDPLE